MASITDIILTDDNTLTAADWDFDPSAGTGSGLFAPTVSDDDGCIDTLRDSDGFLNFA